MNYEQLSRYRAALMGLAMLFVMCFHVPMAKGELMYGVVRLGNIGVDMFLFLSGIGLWFSWTKNVSRNENSYESQHEGTDGNLAPRSPLLIPRLKSFYRKRMLRIYPAWLLIACLYYIPDFFGTDLFGQFHYAAGADWHSVKSPDVFHLVANILVNWSFWRIDDGAFWFIPHHDDVCVCPVLYGVDSPLSRLSLVAGGGDGVGHDGAVYAAHPRCSRPH